MPHFGARSRKSLSTCDVLLQLVAAEAINDFDFTVIEGHRSKKQQDAAVRSGASKLRWPKSKHNTNPSRAMDCIPYPPPTSPNWDSPEDRMRFGEMAMAINAAERLGIELDWGYDLWKWDMPHFELREK